jgi:hypothetical protein
MIKEYLAEAAKQRVGSPRQAADGVRKRHRVTDSTSDRIFDDFGTKVRLGELGGNQLGLAISVARVGKREGWSKRANLMSIAGRILS